VENLLIKIFALIYRKTGYYCPYLSLKEYKYISDLIEIGFIEKRWAELNEENTKDKDNDYYTFATAIGIEKGLWQVNHSIYRRWKKGIFGDK